MKITEHLTSNKIPMGFDIYQSDEDGVWVVHVDTEMMKEDTDGPVMRIYLNDEVIFENPPLSPLPSREKK